MYLVFGVTDVVPTLLSGDTMTEGTMVLTGVKGSKRIIYDLYFQVVRKNYLSTLHTQFNYNVKQIFSDGRWRIVLPKFNIKELPVLYYSVITNHAIFI